MRILVVGAGMMARAIAYALVQRKAVEEILLADREPRRADAIASWLADPRVRARPLDAAAPAAVREAMAGCAVAVSAAPYFLNLGLAEAAVDVGAHFCDLGGNNRVVEAELALDQKAKQAGVTLIPDCGLAPGLVNVLTMGAIDGLDPVESVRIRVGGLPERPRPPLGYEIVFSPHGLVNEYMEEATVLRKGKAVQVPSLTEPEPISFPAPFGDLEAFHTSGGSSTLPRTLAGRVADLDYKTIRYRGHREKVKTLADLGFFDLAPRLVGQEKVVPRDLAVVLLTEKLSFGEPDVVLLRVVAVGKAGRVRREVRYQMIDRYDEERGLSAMMRTTGFPIAEIAFMLASGAIGERGALPQERCVPPDHLLAGLRRLGLEIERTVVDL